MKLVLAFVILSTSINAYSKSCRYKVENPKLTWTGYKFSEKAGVSGTFDTIQLKASQAPQSTIDSFLETITFDVDVASINSKLDYRDKKLALYLFGNLVDPGHILGRVASSDSSEGAAKAQIILNGIKRLIPFHATAKKGHYTWSGKIDLVDFQMSKAVQTLHGACKTLHTGKDNVSKTWSEVGLKIEADISSSCS